MMKQIAVLLAVASCVACASAPPDDTTSLVPPPQTVPQSDARLAEIQTTMTELLERLDVLNDRVTKLENATPAPALPLATPPQPSATPQPVPQPARETAQLSVPAQPPLQRAVVAAKIAEDYRNAIMLYGRNRVADSRRAFQAVFDADPSGDLADNALFWIGETYFAAGDYTNAMRYYNRVTNEFAEQNKAPDALFKSGIALEKTGDLALAKKTFEEVIAKYPYSTSAASAKQELKRIKY